MAFAPRHPSLGTPSSHYDGDKTIAPKQAVDGDESVRPKIAHTWPEESSAASLSSFDMADFWKPAEKHFSPTRNCDLPNIDPSLATQLNKCMDLDGGGSKCNPHNPAPWQMQAEQVQAERVRRQFCGNQKWQEGVTPTAVSTAPMSAFQAYSMAPMHQRFASASSGFYSDERHAAASDPGSDFSSDYSDLFSTSGLPPPSVYAQDPQETPTSCAVTDPQHKALPEYVVEELKRLKLENMALRRMAQEVVRINFGSGSLDGRGPDPPVASCVHHPPLSSPPRLRRVHEGADPLQVYGESPRLTGGSTASDKVQESGTAASIRAPGRQSIGSQSQSTTDSAGATEFKASMISAGELRRRVATSEAGPSPFSGYQHVAATDSPFHDSSSVSSLPPHLCSKDLSRLSPRGSPGSTTLIPSRLESAPAATLVSIILDKRGQEASLLLQQQLKNGSPERQDEILQAIRARIVPLSHDRHGNFLVQGAIEKRPETAMHLKGAFVELTMSQFGCHVVQKALEGDEAIRQTVTEELLGSRLDQTLTSRHSIHVWQRILETEWTRPQFREQIFASINRQLKGRWARIARQETGSIICQNIFESAQPAEKAMCMRELLEELDECATNQWGVWVVQHIIEHGAEEERRSALQGLVRSACKLTLSQYGKYRNL